MRLRVAVAALLVPLLILAACGRQPDLPPPSPALWTVTAPGGTQGWLFGTAHALPDGYSWRTPQLDAAFASADTLVVEVDLAKADPGYFDRIATTKGLGPPVGRIAPEYRARLAAAIVDSGHSKADFADTESWAVALAVASAYQFGDPANGVDRALANDRGNKRLVELEGYRGQLDIFDKLSVPDQAEMLELVAAEAETAAQVSEREIEAWRIGDIGVIEADMQTGLLEDPELREALLTGRNRAWAEKIDRLIKDGARPFVAVGAAHLLSEDGLPAMLTARGYTVTRVQ
jgi:uncharacterized protein YbaP (TraB family)